MLGLIEKENDATVRLERPVLFLLTRMGLDILGGLPGNLSHLVRLRSRQPVTGSRDRNQLVRDARLRQLGGHILRFGVRDIGVLGPVDQQAWADTWPSRCELGNMGRTISAR